MAGLAKSTIILQVQLLFLFTGFLILHIDVGLDPYMKGREISKVATALEIYRLSPGCSKICHVSKLAQYIVEPRCLSIFLSIHVLCGSDPKTIIRSIILHGWKLYT